MSFYFNIPYYGDMSGAYSQASGIIDSQMSFANTALAALNSYVGKMVNYATQAISVPIPAAMAVGLDFDFSKEAFDDLFNRKPAMPTINSISVALPDSPVIDVPSIQGVILSNLWNDIYEKLNDDITNGGYGIETDDETALFERGKERERLEYLSQVEEADETFAGSGCKIPPGALIKIRQRARDNYHGKLATLNREIMIKRAELFVQCRQFALEKGVLFGQLFVDIGKLRVGKYEADIKGAVADAEIQQKTEQMKLETYRAAIEGYAAEARVLASLYDLASTQQDREIRCQIAALQANIEIAKAYLTQAIEQAKLRLSGTEAAAEVYKAICASALGTIHASANLSTGFSTSYGYSKGESVSNTYGESATLTSTAR